MSFSEIRIADLGVIDNAVLELGPGLSVITGETGAGKTMLLTGLGLILGEKADPLTVRTGAERAFVEARLQLEDAELIERVHDAGGEMDDDELLISRTVVAAGRSRAFLGGRSVPQAVLGEIARELVTVHGQSDQVRLRTAARQREALDEFAGPEFAAARAKYRGAWQELNEVSATLAELQDRRDQRLAEAEVLRTALAEISEADPVAGEEVELKQLIARLTHSEDLLHATRGAHDFLLGSGDQPETSTVAHLVEQARKLLADGAQHDDALAELAKRAAEIGYLVADLGADLASYSTNVDTDPARLTQTHERLALITGLLRKHLVEDTAELLEWAEASQKRFLELDGDDERVVELQERRGVLEAELQELAETLTALRTQAAQQLEQLVTAELHLLAMPEAQFSISIKRSEPSINGQDDIEFLLAPHRGAPPRGLTSGASGGELSRVMLGIEVALAGQRRSQQHTFVFDEVDAGVGGAAAVEVGRRLAKLARTSQVVVVTHLAQVAAFADQHLVVTKRSDESTTATTVQRVSETERVTELARMLSGQADSTTAQQHAQELLGLALATD